MYYINFSNLKFKECQNTLLDKYNSYGFDCTGYTPDDIDPFFLKCNKEILDNIKGCGYWIWKPYFILKKMSEIEDGEIVLYTDCGDDIKENIKDFVNHVVNQNNGFFLVKNMFFNHQYTKKDCFVSMNCDLDVYWNSYQLEAGVCAFKKCDSTMFFLNQWLAYCENYNIVNDNLILPNVNTFIEHRHDQSILTNLSIKYNISSVSIEHVSRYILYGALKNKLENG